jgi:PKD repeat protein
MLLLCVSASADGAIGHLSGGGTVGYVPVRSPFAPQIAPMDVAFGNLDYSGGPVMPSNTNYTIYWSPGGLTDYPSPTSLSYADGIDQFFADIAHDSTLPQTSGGAGRQNVESVATQYNDADGNIAAYDSHFGGRIVDTAAYPSSGCAGATICLTKAQMETEIARVVHDNHLPDDLTHQYFLITPPGVESCFDDVGSACSASSTVNPYYCAFHGNIGTSNPIIYSIDNWVVRNPGCDSAPHLNGSSDGVIAGGMSHEHNEAITDPIPNSAWTDYGGVGPIWENGDKCNGESVVQVINHHTYIYQPEWSNFTGQCLARLPLAPIPVSASFTTVRTSPTTADFTATSDAGAGAKYVWQFNDYPPPDTPQNYTVETDSPQITHEFPAAGTYTVALTVMRSDGMSRGAANDVTLGTAPTAAFTAPANAVAGSDLAFDASGSTSVNNGLGAYRWEWGDGTADASGATPMHRFRSGGTFQVRLTVTDGIGLTNSTTRDVAVADAPTGLAVQSVRPVYGRHAVRITTVVNTSGPGAVTLVATTRRGRHGVVRCTRAARAAGAATMVISCTLGTDARDAIRRGRLPVRVATTFTPDAGTAQTMSRVVTLTRHP